MPRRVPNLNELRRQIHDLGVKGDYLNAARAADRALALWPDDAELHLLRALAAERLGEWQRVVDHAERFEALAPDMAPMDISAGGALLQLSRPSDAKRRLERAVEQFSTNPTAWMNLGIAEKRLGDLGRALACQRRAAELAPRLSQPWLNMASAQQDFGDPSGAASTLGEYLARSPMDASASSFRAFLNLTLPQTTPIAQRHLAESAGEALTAASQSIGPPARFRNDRKRSKRLRVGFFSGDFRDHSVASFALPLIESLDRQLIEPVLFSTTNARDAVTEQFAAAASILDVSALEPSALVRSARASQLDVAIDLAGHTVGNALLAFAARIAPVQVTWLGYAGTTGLATMDARIVDSRTDPVGSEVACTERIVRLDPCFLCWRTRIDVPLPERHNPAGRAIVFGCFNDISKLSDPTLDAWATILERVTNAKLLLKNFGFKHEASRRGLIARLAARGIHAERVETIAWTASYAEHLALYGRVDVALDSFPYNGTTTTCESLWMGTPVVALEGTSHQARVSASLLRVIGRDDLVATDVEQYVQRAVELALDDTAANAPALRLAVQASPLRNEKGFATRFEAILREEWRSWCDRTSL